MTHSLLVRARSRCPPYPYFLARCSFRVTSQTYQLHMPQLDAPNHCVSIAHSNCYGSPPHLTPPSNRQYLPHHSSVADQSWAPHPPETRLSLPPKQSPIEPFGQQPASTHHKRSRPDFQ